MKRIVFSRPDGGVTIVVPHEGERLAISVILPDGTRVDADPQPADRFFGRWPIDGALVAWAETEEVFLSRIAAKDAPGAVNVLLLDESELPQSREARAHWKLVNGAIVVDEAAFARAKILAQLADIDRKTGMVRGVRESILALGVVIDQLRSGPLPAMDSYGTGMDKLRQVEALAKSLRDQLAPH